MHSTRGRNRPPFAPKMPGTDLRDPNVPTAIIHRPARNVMQSGPRPSHWILQFEPTAAAEIEPLMGWTATRDPYRQIRQSFPDRESAVDYAVQQDWNYIVRDADQRRSRGSQKPSHRTSRPRDNHRPKLKGGQLRIAEALGYGNEDDFEEVYENLEPLDEQIDAHQDTGGILDTIRESFGRLKVRFVETESE